MIKKYKQYIKESLLDKLQGFTEEELLNNLSSLNPNEMLSKASKIHFLKGIKIAIERGADVSYKDYNAFLMNNSRSDSTQIEIFNYLKEKSGLPDTLEEFLQDLFSKEYKLFKHKNHPHNNYYVYNGDITYIIDDKYLLLSQWVVNIMDEIYYTTVDGKKTEIKKYINKLLNKDFIKIYCVSNTEDLRKNIEQITESLIDKLQGPSKEELLKNFGFKNTYKDEDEFLNDLFSNLKIRETDDYDYYELNNKIILVYDYEEEIVKVNTKLLDLVENVFGNFPYKLFRSKIESELNIKNFKMVC